MHHSTLPLQQYLVALHERFRSLHDGQVATYIPELAKANPDDFGICIVTADGYVYAVGDSDRPITIQSISKPIVYAAALADRGREQVLAKVGVEPSGEAFNSISLDPQTGAPLNPMINAGAIASAGLLNGDTAEDQWARVAGVMADFIGHEVTIDDAVYRSESETGFRNRAIAWMLKNFGIIEGDPMPVLENYFRQCSINVTCRDLAFMAATLANAGVHPVTGKHAVPAEDVQSVLSIMATCGMYDYAGGWLYEVGLPAKSGVSGGIIAVMPGRFGIAIYSPRLDENGNSARGIAVCRQISRDFGLHVFGVANAPSLVLSRTYTGDEAPSRRTRAPDVATRLQQLSSRIKLLGLQGEVAFDGAEYIVRYLLRSAADADSIVLDMNRVSIVSDSAARQLHDARRLLTADGRALVFSRIRGRAAIQGALRRTLPADDHGYLSFEDNDVAIEWCENRLLASEGVTPPVATKLADFAIFTGTTEADRAELESRMQSVDYAAGAVIVAAGQLDDDRVFFIRDGEVSVVLELSDGSHQRVATLTSGMSFGELSMLGPAGRSATIFADTAVSCWTLRADALDQLSVLRPEIKIAVLINVALDLAQKLRQANKLIRVLAT
jgi:glutaminase